MNIKKVIITLFLGACTCGQANQINMSNVRAVTAPIKTEVIEYNEEQDLDEPIDFGTEGELNKEDLEPPLWVFLVNKIVSRFFMFYNWLQKKD